MVTPSPLKNKKNPPSKKNKGTCMGASKTPVGKSYQLAKERKAMYCNFYSSMPTRYPEPHSLEPPVLVASSLSLACSHANTQDTKSHFLTSVHLGFNPCSTPPYSCGCSCSWEGKRSLSFSTNSSA